MCFYSLEVCYLYILQEGTYSGNFVWQRHDNFGQLCRYLLRVLIVIQGEEVEGFAQINKIMTKQTYKSFRTLIARRSASKIRPDGPTKKTCFFLPGDSEKSSIPTVRYTDTWGVYRFIRGLFILPCGQRCYNTNKISKTIWNFEL